VPLLREIAQVTGLVEQVTQALADTYRGPWFHPPGQVFVDLACAIADGARSVSGIGQLGDREQLHGPVASIPTTWRLVDKIDRAHLGLVRAARGQARAAAWAGGADPDLAATGGWLHIDVDATIVVAHSEKENAAATWKKTYGFHPLLAFLDRSEISDGEGLAGLLWPGNAGSNTAADHITVLDLALASLPADARPAAPGAPKILIRSDSAGATYDFAAACRKRRVGFSFGCEITAGHVAIADAVAEELWAPAIEDDGIREGAWVLEATDCLDLSKWPSNTRLILRKERPHPGANLQLHNTTADGMRLTGFLTDTPERIVPHQIAGLELRHRQHARVEARIKNAKHTGMGNLPLDAYAHNAAWLETVLAASDLVCWAKLICFKGHPGIATATPETFRYKVLHVAGKITKSGRCLHLKLDATWRWAPAIAAGWQRLRAAFP
jgi:hypothetical protein